MYLTVHQNLLQPIRLEISRDAQFAVVADRSNHRIRRMEIAGSQHAVITLAGQSASGYRDSTGNLAMFANPQGVTLSPDSSYAVVTEHSNRLRKVVVGDRELFHKLNSSFTHSLWNCFLNAQVCSYRSQPSTSIPFHPQYHRWPSVSSLSGSRWKACGTSIMPGTDPK